MLRLKQYSKRTEEGDVQWYKRYVLFHAQMTGRMKHPQEMGTAEVTAFLTNRAVNKNLAAASQNQVLNALVFLCREVLIPHVIRFCEFLLRATKFEPLTRC